MILNGFTGDFYIGSSGNVFKRMNQHYLALKGNKHTNLLLQNSWNTSSFLFFEFLFIMNTSVEEMRKKELILIKILQPTLNISKTSLLGVTNHSLETRQKISLNIKGKPKSFLHKQNISIALSGKCKSEEHTKKNSESHKGLQVKEKNGFYGKKHSSFTKNKIKEKRKLQEFSEETRKKMSESRKKFWASEEGKKLKEKLKINTNPFKGKHHSFKSRQKMSAAAILRLCKEGKNKCAKVVAI
jgi:group I intron endonuclease